MATVQYHYGKNNSLLRWYHPIVRGVTYNNVVVIDWPKSELKSASIDMCTQPKLSPEKMYNLYGYKPDVVTNAFFFDTASRTSIWNLKSNNTVYAKDGNFSNGWGITNSGKIMNGVFNNGVGWRDFGTEYPALFKNKQPQSVKNYADIDYEAKRQMFGWTKTDGNPKNEKYFIVSVVSGGMKLSTAQNLIKSLFPDVDYCCNQDGGNSTYTNFEGKRLSASGWLRPVDSILAFWLRSNAEREKAETEEKKQDKANKKEENRPKKTGYRCQLGAFSNSTRAITYRNEIRTLTGVIDYSTAFCIQDPKTKLYKVQVGFFSKKTGAEKVKADLAEKGYNCYICYVEE